LQGLQAAAREADAKLTEPEQSISKAALQQLVEEQIRPLREQVRRLEERHAVRGTGE